MAKVTRVTTKVKPLSSPSLSRGIKRINNIPRSGKKVIMLRR
jgi:hypothetical protein